MSTLSTPTALPRVETQNKYRELAERICEARVQEIRVVLDEAHTNSEPAIDTLEKIRNIIERH